MSLTKGVTARKPHPCDTCSRITVTGDYRPAIFPGQRYLAHTTFPGDPGFEEGARPVAHKECASCAIGRDDFTATEYGICGSYCHGTTPCALPFEKGAPGHEHACRECVMEVAR